MKKKFLIISLFSLACCLPLNSFGDFDFGDMDFGSMDFGSMDFGGMDFGDFGGDGDFGDLFGSSNDNNSFDDNSYDSYDTDTSSSTTNKKKEEIKEPESIEVAFKENIQESVKKLTKTHKQAIESYLSAVAIRLHTLITHCSSFVLGIKLKADLKESTDALSQASQFIDTIHTKTIYHLPLLYKEFSGLREKLMALPEVIDPLNKKFSTLAATLTDTLDVPSAKQQKEQKALFKSITDSIKSKITPLIADLKKVIGHKKAAEIIKIKQQKYKAKLNGSYASGSGGWGSGASRYFNDGYSDGGYGGYGSGSNWGSSGGWGDDSWDSGGNWDSGGWGNSWGGSDYNSSSNWGGDNSYSRNSGSSSKSRPNRTVSGNSSANSFDNQFNFDDYDDYDTDNYKNNSIEQSSGYVGHIDNADSKFDGLPLEEQITKLIALIKVQLGQWNQKYTEEKSPAARISLVKSILENRSFAMVIKKITSVIESKTHEALSDKAKAKYAELESQLITYLPLCIHAATYASPPFALYFAEKAIAAKEKVDTQKSRTIAEMQKKQRLHSYQELIKWLGTIRSLETTSPLFEAIIDNLLKYATEVLNKISYFTTASTTKLASFDEIIRLTTLSRQLFHEPVVIGYSAVSTISEEEKEKRTKKLVGIRERKAVTSKAINTYLTAQYELSTALITTIEEAATALRAQLGIDESTPLNFEQPAVVAAFSEKLSIIINAQDTDIKKDLLRTWLLPYNKKGYQDIEIQHALLAENLDLWRIKKPEQPTDTADINQDDLYQDQPLEQQTNANNEDTSDLELEQLLSMEDLHDLE